MDGPRPFSYKKQAHPDHADHCANDLPHRDFLMEKEGRRRDDEDGGKCEKGLGNTRRRVRGRQQRGADPDERPEDSGGEHAPHRLAVADSAAQFRQPLLAEQHQRQEEACQSDVGADGGGGEGHAETYRQRQQSPFEDGILGDVERCECCVVMLEAYLAEYQSKTLADAGHGGVENSFCRQLESYPMVFSVIAFGENRHRNTAQGDNHAEDGDGAHLFAEEESSGERGRRCRKGHEQLSEARPDVDVALHQAVVADNVADHARE